MPAARNWIRCKLCAVSLRPPMEAVWFHVQWADVLQAQRHRSLQLIELQFRLTKLSLCLLYLICITLTAQRLDVARWILLEHKLQWVYIIELYTRYAADKTVGHGSVLANVHILNIIELRISRSLNIEMVLNGLVVIHSKHNCWSAVLARKAHIVVLTQTEMLLGEYYLLTLEAKVKDTTQMTWKESKICYFLYG